MKRFLILIFLSATFPASAAWLKMDKSPDGFLFQGADEGEHFSFNVPGRTVRTTKDAIRAFAEIDGVLIQIMLTPDSKTEFISTPTTYAASERAFLESAGAVISSSDVCSSSPEAHAEWASSLAGHTTRYFVADVGMRILVVTIVRTNSALPDSAVERTLRAICTSLTVI